MSAIIGRCVELRLEPSAYSKTVMQRSSFKGASTSLFVMNEDLEDAATKMSLYRELIANLGFKWEQLDPSQRNYYIKFHHRYNSDLLDSSKAIHESKQPLEDVAVSVANFEFV